MKIKKRDKIRLVILIINVLLITFSLCPLIKANQIEENDKNTFSKYNSEVLDAFNHKSFSESLINQTDFIGLKIIDNQTWAKVIINIRDNSGIEFSGTKEERLEQSKQKDEWFEPIIQEVLDDISETEIRDINKGSNGFGALVTREGFEKLINDDRIEKVIWSQYGPKPFLDKSAVIINANDAWSAGYAGDGIKVCVIDSGVD